MILEELCVGPLQANCYLVGCSHSREGIVVDPGADAARIIAAIERLGLQVRYVLNTHGHVDHVAANAALRRATGARLLIHEADRELIERPHPFWAAMVGGVEPSEPDGTIDEGDELAVGQLAVRVLHTPGHTPGCVCFALEDLLLTGDTLFAGSVGRTDLPGGSAAQLRRSLLRLREQFAASTCLLPGHGPRSTMGAEASSNPFLLEL
ncbi:MAG: MBL fold metallo-hydrolase [Armatimonadota bacterium]